MKSHRKLDNYIGTKLVYLSITNALMHQMNYLLGHSRSSADLTIQLKIFWKNWRVTIFAWQLQNDGDNQSNFTEGHRMDNLTQN